MAPKTDWITGDVPGADDFNRIEENTLLLGSPIPYFGSVLPAGFLWADGKTIGDASSGATALANAAVKRLYLTIWGASALSISDSTGVATTRGATAEDDFNAHKRLRLPDLRGRTIIGLDNMGGTSANTVTNANADVLGGIGGEQAHSLSGAENGSHGHAERMGNDLPGYIGGGGSNYTIAAGSNGSGSTGRIYTDGSGSGNPHNIMQPWIACNYIMRY